MLAKTLMFFYRFSVLVNLYRAYCPTLYTAPLWCMVCMVYKKGSFHKLTVAYNDAYNNISTMEALAACLIAVYCVFTVPIVVFIVFSMLVFLLLESGP